MKINKFLSFFLMCCMFGLSLTMVFAAVSQSDIQDSISENKNEAIRTRCIGPCCPDNSNSYRSIFGGVDMSKSTKYLTGKQSCPTCMECDGTQAACSFIGVGDDPWDECEHGNICESCSTTRYRPGFCNGKGFCYHVSRIEFVEPGTVCRKGESVKPDKNKFNCCNSGREPCFCDILYDQYAVGYDTENALEIHPNVGCLPLKFTFYG